MPISDTYPGYTPSPGEDIDATWGAAISETVIPRFASVNDAGAKYQSPDQGSLMRVGVTVYMHTNGQWRPLIQMQSNGDVHIAQSSGTWLQADSIQSALTARLSDINALKTRVGNVESKNSSQDTTINGKASTSSVTNLTSRVSTLEGKLKRSGYCFVKTYNYRAVNASNLAGNTNHRTPSLTGSSGAVAAIANITVAGPTQTGHLIAWPSGTAPGYSHVNFEQGEAISNAVVVPLSSSRFYYRLAPNSAIRARVVIDIQGYLMPAW